MNKKILTDAEKAALVQSNQYSKIIDNVDKLENIFDKIKEKDNEQFSKLNYLKEKTNSLLKEKGIDINNISIENINTNDKLKKIRDARAKLNAEKIIKEYGINLIETIDNVDDWDSYITAVEEYANKYDVDLKSDPYRQLLTDEQYKEIIDEYHLKFGKVEWCACDYAVVGLSVIVAILTDYFLVAVPPKNTTITINGIKKQIYQNQTYQGKEYNGSPITKFLLKNKNEVMNAKKGDSNILRILKIHQRKLENFAKVPFDPSIHEQVKGLNPRTHRIQSFGHDPLFGIIFGVRDIMTGKFTAIGRDSKIQIIDMSDKISPEKNPFMALVKWICHILSDIPTTKGIPVPGLSILQCVKAESPFSVETNGAKLSFNDLARWMYVNGYTIDHFITMSIVPLIIELFIGVYYTVSNFDLLHRIENYNRKEDVKLQSMLALAHTLTMGGNISKMAFMSWNPTAFNLAECMQMVRTWMKLYKAQKERDLKINKSLYEGWQNLEYSFLT